MRLELKRRGRAVVVGLGSYFCGDDAVGFEVVEEIKRHQVPPGVELALAPGGGLDAVDRVRGAGAAVLVDATLTGAPAGTVRSWEARDLAGLQPGRGPFVSTHGLGLLEALAAARRLEPGSLPRCLWVVGVEAGDLTPGRSSLGPEAARAVPEAAGVVLRLLGAEANRVGGDGACWT